MSDSAMIKAENFSQAFIERDSTAESTNRVSPGLFVNQHSPERDASLAKQDNTERHESHEHAGPFPNNTERHESHEHAGPFPNNTERHVSHEPEPVHKKAKSSLSDEILSYSGKPVQPYTYPQKYDYNIHEAAPKAEAYHEHNLWVESMYPSTIRLLVLPALHPYIEEDDEIKLFFTRFEERTALVKPEPVQVAMLGDSGSGKSTTFNTIVQVEDLSNASISSASVTLVPQTFRNSTYVDNFRAEINIRHARAIRILLNTWMQDIRAYLLIDVDERSQEENEELKTNAEAAQEVLVDLFVERPIFSSLEDIETHFHEQNFLGSENVGYFIDELTAEVMERLEAEGIDRVNRRKVVLTQHIDDLQAQTSMFSERGGLASMVTSIQNQIHSPFLARGIEMADLPGVSDTSRHIRKSALDYLVRCSKVMIVADMARVTSSKEVAHYLDLAIRKKKAKNVFLVLRGKETVEEYPTKCTPDQRAKITQMKQDIRKLQAAKGNGANIKAMQQELLMYKIGVRDKIVADHFRSKHTDSRSVGTLTVITISNTDHQRYVDGENRTKEPVLPHTATGIAELRAMLCKAPNEARILSNQRQIKDALRCCQRVLLCFSMAQLLRRDTVTSLFKDRAHLPVEEYRTAMQSASKKLRVGVLNLLRSTWQDVLSTKIDSFFDTYKASLPAFFKKRGTHNPRKKGEAYYGYISWNHILLEKTSTDMGNLQDKVQRELSKSVAEITEVLVTKIDDLKKELEQMAEVGGADLALAFKSFERETTGCTESIADRSDRMINEIESIFADAYTEDNGNAEATAFVTAMNKIYEDAINTYAKGAKLGRKRIDFLKAGVTSDSGPFRKMADEIAKNLRKAIDEWSKDIDEHIQALFVELQSILSDSFLGKKMSAQRRTAEGPEVISKITEAMTVLEIYLEGYSGGEA